MEEREKKIRSHAQARKLGHTPSINHKKRKKDYTAMLGVGDGKLNLARSLGYERRDCLGDADQAPMPRLPGEITTCIRDCDCYDSHPLDLQCPFGFVLINHSFVFSLCVQCIQEAKKRSIDRWRWYCTRGDTI
ncbi:unnamed protein product [Trichogramma brassicae]|uniref:Uncharacterized protein n=1 Tax=Trichogramma brassicae TaxID=86971 RepID=A0A6H5JAV4_9HYME|nr:unnamed protein product [Trichogramma brassicae]